MLSDGNRCLKTLLAATLLVGGLAQFPSTLWAATQQQTDANLSSRKVASGQSEDSPSQSTSVAQQKLQQQKQQELVENAAAQTETADPEISVSKLPDSPSKPTTEGWSEGPSLELADVVASLYRSYPEVERARQEAQRVQGDLVAAMGEYDTKIQGSTISEPIGFYKNYRHGIGVARQTWWGGYLSAGYRIGRGSFEPWYKERETDKGGEFKIGLGVPLLQGRAIDPQRLAVFQTIQEQRGVEPRIQQAILDSARDAAIVYWNWVAAGQVLNAQKQLLEIAEKRGAQFEEGFKAEKFAEIDVVLNRQLIAERSAKVLESEQKFRATAYKLSLYLRNESGDPLLPDDSWLPNDFPISESIQLDDLDRAVAEAIAQRPEPQLLLLELRQLELARQQANNQLLPSMDLIAEASQDTGTPASSLGDKSPFELVVGLQGEMPIQRRKARGKIQSLDAKCAQIQQKLRLQADKIGIDLRTSLATLELWGKAIEQNKISVAAALDSLERYRFAFQIGKIDLIYLNLLESKANEAEIKLFEAQRNWFMALAEMQAVLGLDPLDQSLAVASLPKANSIPSANEMKPIDGKAFDQDWKRHITPVQPGQ